MASDLLVSGDPNAGQVEVQAISFGAFEQLSQIALDLRTTCFEKI